MLVNTVRDFIRNELAPLEAGIEATGELAPAAARAIFEKSRALGLYAMNIPAEHGGGGLSAVDTMLTEEQFGHTTDILIRRAFGNVYEPLLHCKGAQVERWLQPSVEGRRTCAIAITERQPTAPLADLVTATGDSTWSVEDLVVATKLRMLGETADRPAVGLRLATKLPNASNESGIGLDTTDFTASLLLGKTVRSVRTVVNGGFGILGDPVVGNRQSDVITYGVSLARALTQAAEVVGEVNGRFDTREDEPDRPSTTRAAARLGARYTVGGWRGDAAVIVGLTGRDPGIGFAAGFTYVFNAFQIP